MGRILCLLLTLSLWQPLACAGDSAAGDDTASGTILVTGATGRQRGTVP